MRQITLALVLALAPVAALAASLGVPLDQSVRIGLAAPLHDVIVGNPAIAEVQVADDHHVIVTGKTAGVTNLIIISPDGRRLFDRQLVVGASTAGRVTVIAGDSIKNYACAGQCEQSTSAADVMNTAESTLAKLGDAMGRVQPGAASTSSIPAPAGAVTPSPMLP